MERANDLLETVTALMIFCLAALTFIIGVRYTNIEIRTVQSDISDKQIVYQQSIDEIPIEDVRYDELIGILQSKLDYDIEVNGITYTKDTFNPSDFDLTNIPKSEYYKSYEYDSNGNIKKVIFRS